ncbi:MAG: MFS transporter, partial [Cytophagales bacterium]
MVIKNEKLLLFILAFIQFANIVDFMIMMPLGPQLMRVFNISPAEFSILVASYAISAGISGFISAFFVDKFDRKNVLLVVFIGFTVGTLACAYAPTFQILMFARIFTGIFGGLLSSTVMAIVGDAIPNERRATAMGIVMAAFSVASVVGVPLGLYLANEFSWHAPFLFLVSISILILILIIFYIPSMKTHIEIKTTNTNPFQVFINVLNNNNQLIALLFMFFLMLGQFTVIIFISKF